MSACLNQFGLADINCTVMVDENNIAFVYNDMVQHLVANLTMGIDYNPWIFAALGSTLIGLSGVFPLLIISIDDGINMKNGAGGHQLKVLLSFAVGGLLGDVFLHLLPEAWANDAKFNSKHGGLSSGIILLCGMLLFIVIEKLFSGINNQDDSTNEQIVEKKENVENLNNNIKIDKENLQNGYTKLSNNGFITKTTYHEPTVVSAVKPHQFKHVSGYLNLMANSIDNFTHGLAVGGSFLISLRLGMFTTVAILVHEIPHEIGDFAILLKSGFSRWEAAKAQLCTASGGMIGALVAVASSGGVVEGQTSWILPFTAGGFLHIALVTVLPDLIKEENSKESIKQFLALIFGIIVMAAMTMIE
ncbi:zinc transporter ZIP13 homolog [Chrysoperla carnea]|uniref:zinc transporter ZIP13 homolog n=1 Tax=Chrysoperla carnea TaxID=189513 RepID=UPI001D08BE70|nr:zinc transporter ZIP13 homolog [Chrysoperla carnea]